MGILASLLGGGLISSVEKIATEAIQTDKEKADARAVLLKTIDPNGMLRRSITRFTCLAYGYYLFCCSIFAMMVAFGIGDSAGAEIAAGLFLDLFTPITTAFGTIITASFSVNGVNAYKGQ